MAGQRLIAKYRHNITNGARRGHPNGSGYSSLEVPRSFSPADVWHSVVLPQWKTQVSRSRTCWHGFARPRRTAPSESALYLTVEATRIRHDDGKAGVSETFGQCLSRSCGSPNPTRSAEPSQIM